MAYQQSHQPPVEIGAAVLDPSNLVISIRSVYQRRTHNTAGRDAEKYQRSCTVAPQERFEVNLKGGI
jgi:hypothetical protein